MIVEASPLALSLYVLVGMGVLGVVVVALESRFGFGPPPSATGAPFAMRREGWSVTEAGLRDVLSRLPSDPATVRTATEHGRQGDLAGAVLVTERPRQAEGPTRELFYVWARHPALSGAVLYRAQLGVTEFVHGTRRSLAHEVVAAVVERASDVTVAWVQDEFVGIGLAAATMTSPPAWARWLVALVDAVDAGRAVPSPPARWHSDR